MNLNLIYIKQYNGLFFINSVFYNFLPRSFTYIKITNITTETLNYKRLTIFLKGKIK